MAKKKKFKLPNWLINTLEMTVMVAILMALYNFLGPMVFKNGSYFPWWTFPYSVVGALFLIGGWNFLSHRMNIMHNQIVAEDNAKKNGLNAFAERVPLKNGLRLKSAASAMPIVIGIISNRGN